MRPGWRKVVVQFSTNRCTCVRTALYHIAGIFNKYKMTMGLLIANKARQIFCVASCKLQGSREILGKPSSDYARVSLSLA